MIIMKLLLLLAFATTCCSCSLFSKKPVNDLNDLAKPIAAPNLPGPAVIDNTRVAHDAGNKTVPKAGSNAVPDVFRKEDIIILIKGDPQLNRYQKNAHSLFLCIYQLKDPNTFNQYADEIDGIAKLMECRRFDSTVANAKRLVIQPGQELKDVRDRAEGARFLGIVAGYYGLVKEKAIYLHQFSSINTADSSGTTIFLDLGQSEISSFKVQ
jgi:type VI secretion system VasD/TssJ family lipoprotein